MMGKMNSGLMCPGVILRSHETSLKITAYKYTFIVVEFFSYRKGYTYDSFGEGRPDFFKRPSYKREKMSKILIAKNAHIKQDKKKRRELFLSVWHSI